MGIHVTLSGQFYLTEILAPILILVAVARARVGVRTAWILLFAGFWLTGQVVSDLVSNVAAVDLMKGSALIAVTAMDLLLLRLIVGDNVDYLKLAFLGYGLGTLTGFLLQPNDLAAVDPWKFGLSLAASFIGVALVSSRSVRIQMTVILGLMVANAALGFRSQALVLFLLGLVLLLPRLKGGRRTKVVAIVVTLVGIVSAEQIYASLASSGELGATAHSKYLDQSGGSLGLLSGRGEIIYATLAIEYSPWIGIGSDDEDPANLVARGAVIERRLGSDSALTRVRDGTVPLHSQVLSAWAESGVAALPFWTLVIVTLVGGLSATGALDTRSRVLVAYGCLNSGWDVLFSPLGSFGRFQLALGIVAALVGLAEAKARKDRRYQRWEPMASRGASTTPWP